MKETEAHMVEICNFYGCSFWYDENGFVEVENKSGHLTKYRSAADMVSHWLPTCRVANKNNHPKPFHWVKEGKSTRKRYKELTHKKWSDTEDHMVEICNFYDYSFSFHENGNIEIRSSCGNMTRYGSAEDMVSHWLPTCRVANETFFVLNLPKPFLWLAED